MTKQKAIIEEQPTIESWTPDAEEQKVMQYIYDRITAMKQAKDALKVHEDFNKWEKQVTATETDRSSELKIKNPSKVKNNLTRTAVYSILALTAARNSDIQLIAQSEEDQKVAPVLQAVMDYLTDKANEGTTKLKNILSTLIYGTGIRKRIYRVDTRKIKEIVSYDPETEKTEYEEKTVTDYKDVDLEDVDPRMFYPNERATSDKDMPDCFERKVILFDDLRDQYPESKYPNVKYVSPGGWSASGIYFDRAIPTFGDVSKRDVEIIEYWNKIKDLKILIANGIPLVPVDNPIPYKDKELPYTRSVFQLRDGQHFWGVGLPELVEHDQALLDTLYNLLVDWMKLSIQKPCLRGSGEDNIDEEYELEPGKMIDVNDVNNYKFLDIPPVGNDYFQAIQKIEQNSHKKIGIDDPGYGVKSGGTATENLVSAQAARDRLGLFFYLLDEETEARDAKLKISRIQQFYSEPEEVKEIIGKDGVKTFEKAFRKLPVGLKKTGTEFNEEEFQEAKGKYLEITPESIGVMNNKFAEFEVRIKSKGSVPISKEIMQKRWDDMLLNIAKIPEISARVNWEEVAEETFEKHDFNPEKFIKVEITARKEMLELAEEENERMMGGEAIPATEGATPEHSDRHRALMTSTEFRELDPAIQQQIVDHYEPELVAQEKAQAEQDLQIIQEQKKMEEVGMIEAPQGEMPVAEKQKNQLENKLTKV